MVRLQAVNLRRGDGLLLLSGVVALVGGVVTAVVGTREGLPVLALALAGGLVGLARVSVLLFRHLERLTTVSVATRRSVAATARITKTSRGVLRESRRSAAQAARVSLRVERRTKALAPLQRQTHALAGDSVRKLDEARRITDRDSHRFRTSFDTLPSDLVRLHRVLDRIAPGVTDMPGLGDWAIMPGTLLTMIDEVYRRPGPVTIVECGSGSSTLFLALVLLERGVGGQVVSLDSDADFAEETRAHLRRHGVDGLATVVDAPLVDQQLAAGTQHLWFDLASLPETGPVDVLFVDGPVGGSSPQARYPAIPALAARLAPGALVVLDDTDRPDERQILRRWLDEDHGKHLSVERTNVRSTFLRVASSVPS